MSSIMVRTTKRHFVGEGHVFTMQPNEAELLEIRGLVTRMTGDNRANGAGGSVRQVAAPAPEPKRKRGRPRKTEGG